MSLETIVHGRIGALNWGGVFAIQAPERTAWPVIVWQRISAAPVETLDAPTDFYRSRVQVDCYVSRESGASAARALMEEVVAAMESAPDESAISCAGKTEGYEQEAEVFRASADFYVWTNN